jgi:hypothetical protein
MMLYFIVCVTEQKKRPNTQLIVCFRGGRGHDRMVVGFTTTCAIGAYHH